MPSLSLRVVAAVVQHKYNDFSESGGLLRVSWQEREPEPWPQRLGNIRSHTDGEKRAKANMWCSDLLRELQMGAR